jgi:hypothetical protein
MVFVESPAKVAEYHQIGFVASSRPLTRGSQKPANPITRAEQQIRQKAFLQNTTNSILSNPDCV